MLCATVSYNKHRHDIAPTHTLQREFAVRGAMIMTQSLRVLLVEDSKVLTERLTEALRQIEDIELVGTADSEAGALAAFKSRPVDVIILDLHLKQGTGFGVMRALASAQKKPRIIVLTNYDLPEYKNAAIALGASHFLDKARDYGRLPEVLHEICEAHLSKH
jgi:DNA-binding NarL/FixJ family response regulator